MLLSTLLKDILPISAENDREIAGMTLDSRAVQPNYLFIAMQGRTFDGHRYINEAIARGASAVLQEKMGDALQSTASIVTFAQVKEKLSQLAARFYHYPAEALRIIGVTGTNGKTSCSHFLAHVLQNLHSPCGIIGTLGSGFYGDLHNIALTTPDVISLQAAFRDFLEKGAKAIAMEVSSQGIHQGRIQGIPFDIGVFTNLTRDHLDYHGDVETYAAVKRSFLASDLTQRVVINADDTRGKSWIKAFAASKPTMAFGLKKPEDLPSNVPYVYADRIVYTEQGVRATIYSPWGEGPFELPLIGAFNLSNALAVFCALCWLDIPYDAVLEQIAKLEPVPGRMQVISSKDKPRVVVDYAHTPDALEKVLQTLRAHCTGRLFCLFGCGGDRDKGKRPQMAKIAEKLADVVMVTNDNPRHEQPEEIAKEILKGFSAAKHVKVQLDRAKAIQDIIQCAAAEDWILIAGKGAETYQQVGDEKLPFDDVEMVKKNL